MQTIARKAQNRWSEPSLEKASGHRILATDWKLLAVKPFFGSIGFVYGIACIVIKVDL